MAKAKRGQGQRERIVVYHRAPRDRPTLKELLDWYAGDTGTNRSAVAGLLLYPELLRAWRKAGSPQ